MVERGFLAVADRVQYWHATDLDAAEPCDALRCPAAPGGNDREPDRYVANGRPAVLNACW